MKDKRYITRTETDFQSLSKAKRYALALLGIYESINRSIPKVPVQKHENRSDPISADPIRPFPSYTQEGGRREEGGG